MAVLLHNRRAGFEYHILDTFTAGLSLSGQMVKELRSNKVPLVSKFIVFQKDQLQIIGFGNDKINQNVPLLLSKREQIKIVENLKIKGISCIILNIKTSKRWLKAEIALVKGKKNYDKREDIKKRDLDREERRELV